MFLFYFNQGIYHFDVFLCPGCIRLGLIICKTLLLGCPHAHIVNNLLREKKQVYMYEYVLEITLHDKHDTKCS